jgi:hypothetical protein
MADDRRRGVFTIPVVRTPVSKDPHGRVPWGVTDEDQARDAGGEIGSIAMNQRWRRPPHSAPTV